MIKSNNFMDVVRRENIKPVHAQGHVTIALTDPLTGKIKDERKGKNHVFIEAIDTGWSSVIGSSQLWLTDSVEAIDPTFPLLQGNILGYGTPGSVGAGAYLGTYIAANSIAGVRKATGVNYKFQYEYLTTQANGTIGTVGLTTQANYRSLSGDWSCPTIDTAVNTVNDFISRGATYTGDGRYTCIASTDGTVRVQDNWNGDSVVLNLSAIVGSVAADSKYTAWDTLTGHWYVIVLSTTVANRKVYEFTDQTFSSLVRTIAVPALTGVNYSVYVYNNTLYYLNSYSMGWFNMTDGTTGTVASKNYLTPVVTDSMSTYLYYNNMGAGKYFYAMGTYGGGNGITWVGHVWNMETKQCVTTIINQCTRNYGNAPLWVNCKHPFNTYHIPAVMRFGNSPTWCAATAAKKLDAPVVKTSANGMTVTYELQVLW